MREGLEETLTVMGLGLSERLQRSLTTTNASDQPHATRQAETIAGISGLSACPAPRGLNIMSVLRPHSISDSPDYASHRADPGASREPKSTMGSHVAHVGTHPRWSVFRRCRRSEEGTL